MCGPLISARAWAIPQMASATVYLYSEGPGFNPQLGLNFLLLFLFFWMICICNFINECKQHTVQLALFIRELPTDLSTFELGLLPCAGTRPPEGATDGIQTSAD